MEILGWCKWCGSPITEDDFVEQETEFDYNNKLFITEQYVCPQCKAEIFNITRYQMVVEDYGGWDGLTKADPNYGIWEEDKED